MADEPVQAPDVEGQDSPPQEAPDTPDSPQADEVNWEQRFKDTQADYTRKSQQLSEYELALSNLRHHDPEVRNAAAGILDIELAEDDDDDEEFEDPHDQLRAKVEALEEERQTEKEQRDWSEFTGRVEAHVDSLTKDLKLTDRQRRAILSEAVYAENPSEESTVEIVDGWKQDLQQFADQSREDYIESKKARRAPSGAAAAHVPDLDDPQTRRDYMAQRLQDDER